MPRDAVDRGGGEVPVVLPPPFSRPGSHIYTGHGSIYANGKPSQTERKDSGEPPKLNIEFRSKRTFQGGTDAVPFAGIQIQSNMNWFC